MDTVFAVMVVDMNVGLSMLSDSGCCRGTKPRDRPSMVLGEEEVVEVVRMRMVVVVRMRVVVVVQMVVVVHSKDPLQPPTQRRRC